MPTDLFLAVHQPLRAAGDAKYGVCYADQPYRVTPRGMLEGPFQPLFGRLPILEVALYRDAVQSGLRVAPGHALARQRPSGDAGPAGDFPQS